MYGVPSTTHRIRYARNPCSSAAEWFGPVRHPPRKHAGLHPEVAAVLLDEHIGGHFGRAEHGCAAASMLIDSSMPFGVGVAGSISHRVSCSISGSAFGVSP